jgi:hypothetical protein
VKCPVLVFALVIIYPVVGAGGMWESHAAFERDFSQPLREATRLSLSAGAAFPQLVLFLVLALRFALPA